MSVMKANRLLSNTAKLTQQHNHDIASCLVHFQDIFYITFGKVEGSDCVLQGWISDMH